MIHRWSVQYVSVCAHSVNAAGFKINFGAGTHLIVQTSESRQNLRQNRKNYCILSLHWEKIHSNIMFQLISSSVNSKWRSETKAVQRFNNNCLNIEMSRPDEPRFSQYQEGLIDK